MKNNKWKWISGAVVAVALSAYPIQREWMLRQMTLGGERARSSRPWRNQNERLAYFARKRRFADLWLARDKKNVGRPVEVFLRDPALALRVSAVRALGWLEQPEGLVALKTMQKRIKSGQEKEMRLQTVQLAQGRIQARSFTGQKKLDVFCRSVGLSWGEVVRLSRKINAPTTPQEREAVSGSPAVEVVRETVDLLYSMGKKKGNIRPFAQQLILTPSQKIYLQVAPLSVKQETQQLIKYSILNTIAGDSSGFEELVKNHLIGLGPDSRDQLLLLMKRVSNEPSKFFPRPESTRGYTTLFRAVANIGDIDAVVSLRKIEKNSYKWVSYYSVQSRRKLEEKVAVPDFPA